MNYKCYNVNKVREVPAEEKNVSKHQHISVSLVFMEGFCAG